MDKLFSGQSGKMVLGAVAVILGLLVFNLWIEKSKWYQDQRAKN